MSGRLAKLWDRYRRTPKALRWVVWTIVFFLGTWLALDWEGRSHLNRSLTHWAEQGADLRWEEIVTRDLPEAEDFLSAPITKEWVEKGREAEGETRLRKVQSSYYDLFKVESHQPLEKPHGVQFGRISPLWWLASVPETDDLEVAQLVLKHFSAVQAELSEVTAAASRPRTSPIDHYDASLEEQSSRSGYLSMMIAVNRVYRLLARSYLEVGDHDQVLAQLETILDLARHAGAPEQGPLGFMTSSFFFGTVVDICWLGLHRRVWNEEQLRRIEEGLAQVNLPHEVLVSLRYGAAYELARYKELAHRKPSQIAANTNLPDPIVDPYWLQTIVDWSRTRTVALIPPGVYLRCQEWEKRGLVEAILLPEGAPSSALTVDHLDAYDSWIASKQQVYWGLLLDYRDTHLMIGKKALSYQQLVDLTRISVALERFYLRQGSYPADLQVLIPEFLPSIPEDRFLPGSPIVYERRPNGRYRLSAAGMNRVYEGALATRKDKDGDVVWQYEDTSTEAAP